MVNGCYSSRCYTSLKLLFAGATLRTEVLHFKDNSQRSTVNSQRVLLFALGCYTSLKLLFADATLRPIGLLFVMNLQPINRGSASLNHSTNQPLNQSTAAMLLSTTQPLNSAKHSQQRPSLSQPFNQSSLNRKHKPTAHPMATHI